MRRRSFAISARTQIVVMVLSWLVYCLFSTTATVAQTKQTRKTTTAAESAQPVDKAPRRSGKTFYGTAGLPSQVRDMRGHIFAAVRSGRIEDLRLAIEWNELPPTFDTDAKDDAIAYFKKRSADGQGREILAILSNILTAGYVKLPLGPDIENNLIYVWPYFAEVPLRDLSPSEQVALLRIIPAAEFKAMMAGGKYTGYRLSIGADGTWHEFVKGK